MVVVVFFWWPPRRRLSTCGHVLCVCVGWKRRECAVRSWIHAIEGLFVIRNRLRRARAAYIPCFFASTPSNSIHLYTIPLQPWPRRIGTFWGFRFVPDVLGGCPPAPPCPSLPPCEHWSSVHCIACTPHQQEWMGTCLRVGFQVHFQPAHCW